MSEFYGTFQIRQGCVSVNSSRNEAVRITAEELGIGMGKIAQPLRVALTGAAVSPSIDKTLWLVGRDRSLERISRALAYVAARAAAM